MTWTPSSASIPITTPSAGYQALLDFALEHALGLPLLWAVEGTEVCRPKKLATIARQAAPHSAEMSW
jgi:hypothetical protein